MTDKSQPGILADVPPQARYLEFELQDSSTVARTLKNLRDTIDGAQCVVGISHHLVQTLSMQIEGLTPYPGFTGGGRPTPSTQADLWLWLRGTDRGVISNQSRSLTSLLSPAFSQSRLQDAFKFDSGRDLTGYEDGTENPEGDAARLAGIASDGSSFVAVQQWLHNFDRFDSMSAEQQDNTIGRHRESNEEFAAPDSAHVKRTAQEDFDPEAFLVRRSMPWSDQQGAGLVFVAFGNSFRAFEAQMNRMLGFDDGIEDALFQISMPLTGAYYWCPPMHSGHPDLRSIGIT